MNKKIDEEYKGIKDIYILQCICSELKFHLQQKENIIKEVREYIENNKEYTTIKKATKDWQYGKVIFEESDEDILTEDMIKELLKILGSDK